MALDIVGPLPLRTQKQQYILTYIDLDTQYPDAEPLHTTTSHAVAEALLKIICRLSVPGEILTDCGSDFISSFMMEVYKFLGIHHTKTTPYRPQSNGSSERYRQEAKLHAVNTFIQPTTKNDVRSFLGLFFRTLVPLSDLIKKQGPEKFIWNEQCQKAFNTLKQALQIRTTHVNPTRL